MFVAVFSGGAFAERFEAENFTRPVTSDNSVNDLDYIHAVFDRVAFEEKVPEKLLRAICYAESHFNVEAYNFGDGQGTNHAFGICQVLRKTAEGVGFKDLNCVKDFQDKPDAKGHLVKAKRTYEVCKLFGVYTNIQYAARYLKTKLVQYDGSWISAIAAYNTGTVRICKTGKVLRAKDHSVLWTCKPGGILNQIYIDGVLKALELDP